MSKTTNFEKGTNFLILTTALTKVWEDKTISLLTRMKVCGSIQSAISYLMRTGRA